MNMPKPVGTVSSIDRTEVLYLDAQLLDDTGRMKLLPADFYHQLPPQHLMVWANTRARYGIPTVELVEWLKERIAGRKAIEVGAGCGDLGYHVGIPMTDSYQQVTDPQTLEYFLTHKLAPTLPQDDVEKLDAETAVRQKKPEVVVASWMTQRWKPGDAKGNMHGPREEYLLDRCREYVFIGNENSHADKRILSRPHETFRFPWLVSRSVAPEKNIMWTWKR